ncbi:uncharacterized protein LOC143213454 [Lasioglossum baleicum]|uniref:uncharacterized protein LOC143213454 n=1 Tax=Lasioglossum baleicum TaxID=434251 RepID=UPI003FCCE73E
MQLPGGSTRIPPARSPASLPVIINGSSNISSTVAEERNNGRDSNGSGVAGLNCHRSKIAIATRSCGNGPENVSRVARRSRHSETKTNRRHRVIAKPQLLASTPRRKEGGEE